MTIKNKIQLGFGICLLFFFISSFVSYKGMVVATENFKEYGELAHESSLAGRIQANLLKVRVSVKDYIATHDEQYINTFNERFSLVLSLLKEGQNESHTAERTELLKDVEMELQQYKRFFFDIQQVIKNTNLVINTQMAEAELQALTLLETTTKSAYVEHESGVEYYSAVLMKEFLLAKVMVAKSLYDKQPLSSQQALDYLQKTLPTVEALAIQDVTLNSFVSAVQDFSVIRETYASHYEKVSQLLDQESALIGQLNSIGYTLSEQLESLKLSSIEDQHLLTPRLIESKERTITVIIILNLIAAMVSISAGVLVQKSITRGIKKAQEIASELSKGNLAIEVSSVSKDEMGMLIRSLGTTTLSLKNIVTEVNHACAKVGEMSEELSTITHETTRSSDELSQEMEQISTSIRELSLATSEISNNAVSASDYTSEANGHVNDSLEVVQKTLADISAVERDMNRSNDQIKELHQESLNIGTILEVIQGVAEQTNLLALNAAIEAARAGDQGRGFAVVADEVRTLAQRTQDATGQIESLILALQSRAENAMNAIASSHSKVEGASAQGQLATQNLSRIEHSVAELNGINAHIAAAVEEQSVVTESVNHNVVHTNEICSRNLNSVEDVSASSRELAHMAQHLEEVMSQFKVA